MTWFHHFLENTQWTFHYHRSHSNNCIKYGDTQSSLLLIFLSWNDENKVVYVKSGLGQVLIRSDSQWSNLLYLFLQLSSIRQRVGYFVNEKFCGIVQKPTLFVPVLFFQKLTLTFDGRVIMNCEMKSRKPVFHFVGELQRRSYPFL